MAVRGSGWGMESGPVEHGLARDPSTKPAPIQLVNVLVDVLKHLLEC